MPGPPISPTPSPPRRLLGIQYLRAVAALAVVVYHVCDRFGVHFGAGASGVDLFFVISGVVMWTTTASRPVTPGLFLWHRLARIVPLYWAATLVMAAASVVLPTLLPNLNATPHDVLLSLLFIPFLNPHGDIMPVLAQGWTLNYEMLFYLVFAATLLLPTPRRLPALIGALLLLIAAGRLTQPHAPLLLTVTDPLLAEFGAGALLGHAWQRRTLPPVWLGITLIALGFAVLALIQLTDTPVTPAWRVLLWGLPALSIVTGTLSLEAAQAVPAWPLAARLGDASYSIYLLHPMLIAAILRLHPPLALALPASLALASAAGLLSFALFERPVARTLSTRARPGGGSGS